MRAHSNLAQEIWPSRLAIGPPVADVPAGRCSHAARPVASTPAIEAGLPLGSAPAAASMSSMSVSAAPSEGLTRVHSPNILLVDPTVDTGSVDFASVRLACL